jgi:hypothetical protein
MVTHAGGLVRSEGRRENAHSAGSRSRLGEDRTDRPAVLTGEEADHPDRGALVEETTLKSMTFDA